MCQFLYGSLFALVFVVDRERPGAEHAERAEVAVVGRDVRDGVSLRRRRRERDAELLQRQEHHAVAHLKEALSEKEIHPTGVLLSLSLSLSLSRRGAARACCGGDVSEGPAVRDAHLAQELDAVLGRQSVEQLHVPLVHRLDLRVKRRAHARG